METLDKSPGKISRLFDQIAPRYDRINHFLSLGIDTTWRKRTVAIIASELSDDGTIPGPVLDVCCGTADLSIALARKLTTPCEKQEVFGIDFSPGMLELGRKKIQKLRLDDKITLREGDALDLPFENDMFSVVCVAFGLRNVVDTDRGLAEMVRAAKPGGIVAVLDFDLPRIPLISPLYRFYLERVLPFFGHWVSKNKEGAYDYFVRSIKGFEKGAAMVAKMQNAGLENVLSKRMTLGIVSLYWGRKG